MKNRFFNKFICFLFCLLCSISFTGCTLFSSDSSYTPPADDSSINIDDDITAVVAKDAGIFVRPTDAKTTLGTLRNRFVASDTKNISIELPTNTSTSALYSLIVHNMGANSQSVRIYYETTDALASIRDANALDLSVLPQNTYEGNLVNTKWGNLEAKEELKKNLRNNLLNHISNNTSKLRSSIRADHNGENINDDIIIKIVANRMGIKYNDYTFNLRRISAHAKFFVDKANTSITEDDLTHFESEYENYIYPLLIEQYGEFLDIDGDGKLSIVFSDQYKSLGFAGLFNTADLIPEESGGNGNNRDMIGVWTPGHTSSYTGEYWRISTRETISHEMHHAINFSAKLIRRGYTTSELIAQNISSLGSADNLMEEEWIDEGISVCTEARYRQLRGNDSLTTINNYDGSTEELDSVYNDNRFGYWLQNSNISLTTWQSALNHYGQKGLFFWYLFEQKGPSFIQSITQSLDGGYNNLNSMIDVTEHNIKFEQAIINEILHSRGIADKTTITNSELRFNSNVFPQNLSSLGSNYHLTKDIVLGNGSNSISVAPNSAAYFTISQPEGFSGNTSFRIAHSSDNTPIYISIEKVK